MKNSVKLAIHSLAILGSLVGRSALAADPAPPTQVWEVRGNIQLRYFKKNKSGRILRSHNMDHQDARIVFSMDKEFCKVFGSTTQVNCKVLTVPAEGLIYSTTSLPLAFGSGSAQGGVRGDSLEIEIGSSESTTLLQDFARSAKPRLETSYSSASGSHLRDLKRLRKVLRKSAAESILVNNTTIETDTVAQNKSGTRAVGYLLRLDRRLFAPTGEPMQAIHGQFAMKVKAGNGTVYPVLGGETKLTYSRDGSQCFLDMLPLQNIPCTVETLPKDNSNVFGGINSQKLIVRISTSETLKMMRGLNSYGNVSVRTSVEAILAALEATHRTKSVAYELRVAGSHTVQDFNEGSDAPLLDDSISLDLQF